MKSTKDNRPAVKFSDIVKELHSYANSEQAVIDFASELEKVINLSEEFELSQYYFEDNDAKNYLRKKLNFKCVILTGIKSSTTTISNIKDDFFEIYKDCYHKYVKSGNPFFNRLSIMYDLNLYYDIEQKKFVIYEATNVGYPGDFEFYSKKDFYGTYINRVDSIFPVSISDRGQNSMFKNTTVHQLKKMANNKKVVFQKDKSNNLLIGKRIVYFDEPIQDITFSENQLTEFKSEIIPLLEQIQDKIFIKLTVNSVHPADSSKSNEEKVFDIIHSYQDKYGFYYNLCKLVDWYPKTLKILSIQNENLSCFGKVSYINQLKKKFNLDIDYTFFIFKSSSIKTEKDLFDIIGDDFENVKVLFEGSLSGAELEQYELMRSYGVKEEIASVSLSY